MNLSFQQRFRQEWVRLNPRLVKPGDSLTQVFVGACRETLPGFFAPIRMLWWLLVRCWR